MEISPRLSNIYRRRIYLWNVSNAFRKRAHSSKQHVSVSGTRSVSIRAALNSKIHHCWYTSFNYMIARFVFTLLVCTFASKLVSWSGNYMIFFKLNLDHGFGLSRVRRECNADRCPSRKCNEHAFRVSSFEVNRIFSSLMFSFLSYILNVQHRIEWVQLDRLNKH